MLLDFVPVVSSIALPEIHPNVIEQAKLQSAVAPSAKLFYYLGQCLAKWERGLELLRSAR